MAAPSVATLAIGHEQQPLVIIDGLVSDPDAVRMAAIETAFTPAGQHYPGIRAPLPDDYMRNVLPRLSRAMGGTFGRLRRLRVIDASFSIVTQRPDALHIRQQVPHVDAYGADRIALVHYLAAAGGDGTAFYRHRATGFETIDDARAPGYFAQLEQDLGTATPPAGYINGDTAVFEQTLAVEARYNRALLYRSFVLHSGAIAADATLSADPASGRLTVTAFLQME